MKPEWSRAATLETLGSIVVATLVEEADFLVKYESNWGNHGLPGRRESHVVSALAYNLRNRYSLRSILDDDYAYSRKNERFGRCDLALQLDPCDRPGSWVWIEVKTMPWSDANDKLGGRGSVHEDLAKLDRAAQGNEENLPQAVVLIGYERHAADPGLVHRFHHLAAEHRLDLWQLRLGETGVINFDLPKTELDRDPYINCVVGFWARTEYLKRMSAHGCQRECGSIRAARKRPKIVL